jgi:hypothetical protein
VAKLECVRKDSTKGGSKITPNHHCTREGTVAGEGQVGGLGRGWVVDGVAWVVGRWLPVGAGQCVWREKSVLPSQLNVSLVLQPPERKSQ